MQRFYVFLTLFNLLCFSQSSAADSANDWQKFQSQATQAYQAGDYPQAEQAVQQAIAVAEKADNGGAYKASSLNMLAYIYAAQGQMDQALEAIGTAVDLSRQVPADNREQLSALLFNQGLLLQQADKAEPASAVYQQVIESYLALGQTGEGRLWQVVLAQADILLQQQQTDQADTLLTRAMAGFPDKTAFVHQPAPYPESVDLPTLLARVKLARQQPQPAIELLEAARQVLEQRTQADDERLLNVVELLAITYAETGQADKAAPLREQALALRQQQNAPSLASVMHLNELALRHQLDDNYSQAETLYQQALTLLAELNKSESIEQALVLGNLASLKHAEKNTAAALALFEQSLDLHKQFPQRPIDAARAAAHAAALYYQQRHYAKAEPLFLQALALLDGTAEADDESILIALDNLAALYSAWGKPQRARPYENRASVLKKKVNANQID